MHIFHLIKCCSHNRWLCRRIAKNETINIMQRQKTLTFKSKKCNICRSDRNRNITVAIGGAYKATQVRKYRPVLLCKHLFFIMCCQSSNSLYLPDFSNAIPLKNSCRRTYSSLPNSRLIIRLIYVRNCFIRRFSRIKQSICGLDVFFAR